MIGKGDNGETIVWLGEGDVLISTARQSDATSDNEVVFSQGDRPHPIGEASTEFVGKSTADMQSPVRVQFLNVASLDVLLERLGVVRAAMLAAPPSPWSHHKMRPFFPYYGSKWNMARYYPPPACGVVVEPFAGSAGYATFHDAHIAILVDADPIVSGVWQYLISASWRDIQALPDMPDVGDSVVNYDLPTEAKWLIGFWLNRGSATPKLSRTAYSARSDKAQLNWWQRAKDRICEQLPRIRGWSVQCGPYTEAVCSDPTATWFVDPPYGDKGKFYRVPFKSFLTLGEWCQTLPGSVIVCEGEGATWLPFQPLGSFKTSKGRASESVWLRSSASAVPPPSPSKGEAP